MTGCPSLCQLQWGTILTSYAKELAAPSSPSTATPPPPQQISQLPPVSCPLVSRARRSNCQTPNDSHFWFFKSALVLKRKRRPCDPRRRMICYGCLLHNPHCLIWNECFMTGCSSWYQPYQLLNTMYRFNIQMYRVCWPEQDIVINCCRDWHWEVRAGINQNILLNPEKCYVQTVCKSSKNNEQPVEDCSFLLHSRLSWHAKEWTGNWFSALQAKPYPNPHFLFYPPHYSIPRQLTGLDTDAWRHVFMH